MSINEKQIAWLGVYNEFKPNLSQFFTRRVAGSGMPFMTNMETIAYDEVEKHAREAHILRREDKFPVTSLDGAITKSVTPEVLRDSIPFNAASQIYKQAGQYVYVKGQKVDNRTYEETKRIEKLKWSITAAKEAIATDVFLTGTYRSNQTKNTITYTYPTSVPITTTADFKNPVMFFQKEKRKFQKNSMVNADFIIVGNAVFEYLVDKYNVLSNKVEGNAKLNESKTSDGDMETSLSLFTNNILVMPEAFGVGGTTINTDKWIYMYNSNAFLTAYAGVTNVSGGKASMEAADVLIRETNADEESGFAKTLAESAYCPIVVNPKCIQRYEVTDL